MMEGTGIIPVLCSAGAGMDPAHLILQARFTNHWQGKDQSGKAAVNVGCSTVLGGQTFLFENQPIQVYLRVC